MKLFRKFKVGTKLIFGFSIMIVLMAAIGFTGYQSINRVNSYLDEIFTLRLPSIDYLIEADRDLQQLLVAERSMIFANANSDVFQGLAAEYEENLKQSKERWNKYKALADSEAEKAIIPKYEKAREAWKDVSRQVFEGRLEDTRQGRRLALDLTLGEAKTLFEEMRGYLDQLTELNLAHAAQAHKDANLRYQRTLYTLFAFVGLGILAGLVLSWIITRSVTKPLRGVIDGLTEASDQVSSGSAQLASASQGLAEGASEQAASIEETSSSLEEMSSMTKQNAQNADEARSIMAKASEIVDRVSKHMGEMAEAINDINKSSEETGKIIKTIDEIAFQTNLLALNAAVEAARAGEAGAGFAVVADEVRNLALRAAEAAKDTTDLIETTVKAVQNGNQLTKLTQEAFSENIEISAKLGNLFSEIAEASKEQAGGIDQLNTAVSEMDRVVQGVSATAEESASASEEMSGQAQQMKDMVSELTSLIGGARGALNKGSGMSQAFRARGKGVSQVPEAKRSVERPEVPGKRGELNPSQVIPMEEDDLKSF
jgi:methyl-accepting chemotaxis protein